MESERKKYIYWLSWVSFSTSLHWTRIQDFWFQSLSSSCFFCFRSSVGNNPFWIELSGQWQMCPGPVVLQAFKRDSPRAQLPWPTQFRPHASHLWVFSICSAPHLNVATSLPFLPPALLLLILQLVFGCFTQAFCTASRIPGRKEAVI